jgi:NitT/TauT family transport system substrate-binding protein
MRRSFKRYAWLLIVPILAVLWKFTAPAPASTDSFQIVVTDVEPPVAPNSVIELAQRLGYYARQGVNVKLLRVQGTPIAVAALSAGQGDMANISVDTVLQLVARRQLALKGVISPNKALPYVVVAKNSITSVRMLEGKVVGIGRIGSVDYLQMRNVLERLGVRVDALRYLSVGQPAQRGQALAAGQIDATTMTIGSWISMPTHNGLHVLVDEKTFSTTAPFLTKLSVVTPETQHRRGREIAAVVRATILASRDFAMHPEIWANAMAEIHPEIPRARLDELALAYRDEWSVNGGLDVENAAYTANQLYKTPDFKALPRRVPVSEWIDTSYIKAALKQYGVFAKARS